MDRAILLKFPMSMHIQTESFNTDGLGVDHNKLLQHGNVAVQLELTSAVDQVLRFPSVGVTLPLSDVYEGANL